MSRQSLGPEEEANPTLTKLVSVEIGIASVYRCMLGMQIPNLADRLDVSLAI